MNAKPTTQELQRGMVTQAPRVTFGKHRGTGWSDVPHDYLEWLLRQPDMSEDVKFTAKHALEAAGK